MSTITHEEKINTIFEDLSKKLKTDELIKLMAQESIEWNQGNVDRAIREADTCIFSLDDIAFQRALISSKDYQEKQRIIHVQLDNMLLYQGEERIRYYKEKIKPIIQERDALYNKGKKRFNNLKLYV